MADFLRINGSTRADRHQTISAARDAITSSGGWVTDFKLFSNISVCLNFEISRGGVARLHSSLDALGVNLSGESERALAGFGGAGPERQAAGGEVPGTLQITFVHDEPDLRIEVPAIPG
jgi:hypothetical protein